jgi:serine protease inhibitor
MVHVFNFCPSQALSEEIKGNVVCSALSVQLALAMLHTGAKGETAKKLKKALCLMSTDLEATYQGFKELVNILQVCTSNMICLFNV